MNVRSRIAAVVSTLLLPLAAHAEPVCHRPAAASAAALDTLKQVMATGRFVAYQPTQIRFYDGVPTPADDRGIEAELKALRSKFDGVMTYSSANGAERVADIAARLGFRAVVPGIWDVNDAREIANAIAAARRQPKVVVGLSLANERIFAKERSPADLAARLRALRAQVPSLPIATSEPFHIFVQPPSRELLGEMDFMLANVHPVFQPWFKGATDADAAKFVVNVTNELAQSFCGPILVKETGVPTAPETEGYTAARQATFFAELRKQFPPTPTRAFAYFSAFDAPWRVHDAHPGVTTPQPQEGYWGLWTEDRKPKPAATQIPALPSAPR